MKKLRKIAKILLIGITLIFIGNFSLYIYSFITPKMEITKANMYYLYLRVNKLNLNHLFLHLFQRNLYIVYYLA